MGPTTWQTWTLVATGILCMAWAGTAFGLSERDIINMKSVGVPDSIVISTIQSSGAAFTLHAEDVAELQSQGVSEAVLDAMCGNEGSRCPTWQIAPQTEDERVGAGLPQEEAEAAEEAHETGDDGYRSSNEEEDMIGGRRPSRYDREDDRDERGEAMELAYTPPEIREAINQYKSKKYLSSSYNLYNILDSQKYPEQEVKILYYLADSLYKIELYHSAQVYFLKVAGQGSGTYFSPALTKLVYIWRKTNDPTALAQIIGDVDPEDFPSKVRSDLTYLLARRQFDEQNYRQALRHLEQVSDRSDHYIQAQYVQGVIYNRQGKLKRATGRFTDILRETTIYGDPAEIERVKVTSQ